MNSELPVSKEMLQAWFRTGNAFTSNGVVEFTKQLLAHLPNHQVLDFVALGKKVCVFVHH
jgi:uncharacterized tellurite resistance protein B-like protein